MSHLNSLLAIISIFTIMMAFVNEHFQTPKKTFFPPLKVGVQQFGRSADELNTSLSKTVVEGLGLVYKSYKVTTADGYVLNLNRILHPGQFWSYTTYNRVPVLFLNGLAMHSDAWLLQTEPELNLPFFELVAVLVTFPITLTHFISEEVMCDHYSDLCFIQWFYVLGPIAYLLEGYDVWLGDQRGSLRSQEHINLTVSDWHYWDFSFHETGVFDLPAFIDFILYKTGQPKLVYSGLSLGGAFYYVMCTERPEYQDKLYGGILWQPVGEMPAVSTMPWPMSVVERIAALEWSLGGGEAPPYINLFRTVVYRACSSLSYPAAIKMATGILGRGCHFQEDFCVQLSLASGGTSAKTVLHTIQLFRNGGVFDKYNYGALENNARYGQNTPPTYNISRLRVFTALYSSETDIFAPSRTVLPFSRKFSGLTYTCEMKGVCHGFTCIDPRSGHFVRDSIEVLNSMTGRASYNKMDSNQCYGVRPTL